MKILVADDSKTTRTLLSESLKKLGHEVIPASNGQEAIDIFQNEHPDLIILDVIMEGIDGFECARRIRAIDVNDWIPIIFLSGAIDDENIAHGINAGGDDYLTKPYSEVTLAAKIQAMQRIADMRQKLFTTTQQLAALSSTDALTGIYNRLQFDKALQEKISYVNRYKKILALLFIDLDNFKIINDTLGHFMGDLLLKEVAKRLQSCLRLDDFIARIGGDEFAIILTDIKDTQIVNDIAQKIINTLSPAYNLIGNEIHVSCSIGIACYPTPETNAKNLVKNADIAMYHAKELGRNNFQYFTDELNASHKRQIYLETALKVALENNELFITYQPIYDLKTRKIVRVEALTCWHHPKLGIISPEIFIPLAEEIGLIDLIGTWIIRRVCEQCSRWSLMGYKDCKISINISPRQLLQKNLPQIISDILRDTYVSPQFLELELTESSTLIYSKLSEDILKAVRDMGLQIALDDFGTGYSSLTHLKQLPISAIKIDKSFIQEVNTDNNNAMIVKSMIALGNNLHFDVIAEGIETEEQLQFLITNDCPQGQGYYFTRPLNSEAMTALLEKENKTESSTTE